MVPGHDGTIGPVGGGLLVRVKLSMPKLSRAPEPLEPVSATMRKKTLGWLLTSADCVGDSVTEMFVLPHVPGSV